MSDSMETGGFGQNPAIDKINRINTAASRISAVTELEKKVFQPVQPKQKAVLDKRRQLSQDFQINFKKGGKQENGTVLHGGERRLYTGEHPVHSEESGWNRFSVRTPGRVLPDGRGQTAQILPAERAAGNHPGEWQRRADNSKVESARIRFAAEEVCLLTKEMFPRYEISPVYLCREGKLPTGWFQMEMTDIKAEHIKALSTVKERLVLLTFTYPARASAKWRSIVRQSFRTFRESGDWADGTD